jgi:HD-like signal output (HDOD) protein
MKLDEFRIPDTDMLRRIEQVSGLSENHLTALANQLRLCTARRGEVLLRAGSIEKTSLFVLSGKILLTAADGKSRSIFFDADSELKPVAQLRPCIYQVTAGDRVEYMKIDTGKLGEFARMSESALDDISVHSLFTDFDDADNSIINHLYRNLMDNSIKLPALPSVAERIQRVYQGRATAIESMAHILVSYPDVSRKLNNVARCARDSDLDASGKIRYSIRQLGILPVYCLIMTYAVGKLVNRMPPDHLRRVKSFWEHSLNVAAIGRILAKWTRACSPDLAMLAGLLHGIGVLVIDDHLLEHHHLMLDHLEIDHAIQVMRPEISSLLLRKWNFGDELIQVAEECGDWSRAGEAEADLCDLVLVANYYALLHSDVNHSLPRVDAVPAIGKLGITPEQSIKAMRESAQVRRNIKKLFV